MADHWEPAPRRPLCGVQRIGDRLLFFGEIDESNADDLATRALSEIRAGVVALDLSRVRFFAAAGVRMISAARTETTLDGGVRVVCSPEVMRTLQLCRYTGVDGLRLTASHEVRDGNGTGR
jgi:anti-anti-sigma regulatory factor